MQEKVEETYQKSYMNCFPIKKLYYLAFFAKQVCTEYSLAVW